MELYTMWFSLGDTGSVKLFVSEFVNTLNKGFVLRLEKMAKNISNWISSQTFLELELKAFGAGLSTP